MDRENIKKILKEIFVACSLMDETEEDIKAVEENAEEVDSFTYISLILDIEERFDVEIPEEYLEVNLLLSIENLCDLILELKN